MALERIPLEHRMVELLDRVLDKGVVIDAAARVALVGIHLMDMDTRVVVASFQTYVRHVDAHAADRRAAQRRAMEVGRTRTRVASEMLDGKEGTTEAASREEAAVRGEPPTPPLERR